MTAMVTSTRPERGRQQRVGDRTADQAVDLVQAVPADRDPHRQWHADDAHAAEDVSDGRLDAAEQHVADCERHQPGRADPLRCPPPQGAVGADRRPGVAVPRR
jgi:hypothetical protein